MRQQKEEYTCLDSCQAKKRTQGQLYIELVLSKHNISKKLYWPVLAVFFQLLAGFGRALNSTLDFVQGLIDEIRLSYDVRSSNAPANYVDSFLKAKADNCGKFFTENEMLASVAQLFAAGSDTTSTTLRFGLYYLSIHQDIQEKVFDEIAIKVGLDNRTLAWEDRLKLPYVEACLMEIQRISNLLPISFMHRTMSQTKLCGYDIPADTLVLPFLGAVLNDPKYFPEPEKFDPERFLDQNGNLKKHIAWIPFSAGKRICMGESLARLELFIFFTALIMRFRFGFPDDQPCHHIERSLGFLSHPKNYRICINLRS
uniref:Cytochrome P450 n=1 Tax=Romanomermis culicivorax TaxID=13658 RepID=A0A915L4L3_ROMCU